MDEKTAFSLVKEVSALAAHVENLAGSSVRLANQVERIGLTQAHLEARVEGLEARSSNTWSLWSGVIAAAIGALTGSVATAIILRAFS